MKDSLKTFDAVKEMRTARDTFSKEVAGMDFERQRRYIAKKLGSREREIRNAK